MAVFPTAPARGSWPAPSFSAWALQQVAAGVLLEVATRCEAAGLPVLAVKGVVTSRLLYGDVAQRPLTDVDVRIRPRDLQMFKRVAASAGWPPPLRELLTYQSLIYDFRPLPLDVETGVGPPGLCGLDVQTMLRRTASQEIAPGRRVLVPEIHDHAVLLTVNAFKDKIVTAPAWALADLDHIVVHSAFDHQAFVARVVEARISTVAWIVASWMESVRGSEAWRTIRVGIESRGHVRSGYARRFHDCLMNSAQASMSLRLLARGGADSRHMRIRALATAVACSAELRVRAGLEAFR